MGLIPPTSGPGLFPSLNSNGGNLGNMNFITSLGDQNRPNYYI